MTCMEWAKAFGAPRHVAQTTLKDGTWISTVWLGIDHSFSGGPPLIFETMVFPSKDNLREQLYRRYTTEAEAKAGHAQIVYDLKKAKKVTGDSDAASKNP